MFTRFAAAAAATLALVLAAGAEPGDPVAVRWWGHALVTIETHWGHTVAIDPYAKTIGYRDPEIEAQLVLITHNHFDHDNEGLIARGIPHVERGLNRRDEFRSSVVVLDRPANAPRPFVGPPQDFKTPTPNAVRASTISSFHDDIGGAERGANAMWLVEVDAVRILHCGDLGQTALTEAQLEQAGAVDVLLIPVGGVYTIDGKQAAAVAEQIRPRYVVPIHYKTERLTIELEPVDGFLEALPERYARVRAVGNTLAVSARRGATVQSPRVVVLKDDPWPMPREMEALFERKEAAARASQAVFRGLSEQQMNHRPANGTHTPRWNVEHMAGRELGFFSAAYAAADPAIPHMDANPKQMPDDYAPAHPDWTGAEEARRIERGQRFSKRFAYLLDGKKVDDRLEGVPRFVGTPRALLERMIAHWGEHTANVEKKFELEDWPAE